jgi:hypothetical protein
MTQRRGYWAADESVPHPYGRHDAQPQGVRIMTVVYSIAGTPTSPDAIDRLKASSRESSLISQRLSQVRTRMWAVVMGGDMTGKVTWTMDFPSAEAALTHQAAFDADPEAQDFYRRTMLVDPAVRIDNIDLLPEIDLGTASETTTPSVGMVVILTVRPGGLPAAVTALAKGADFMRDLGCTSHRLLATGVGSNTNSLVAFTEFAHLSEVGRVVDSFNDPLNSIAQGVRAPLDAPDTPVINMLTAVIQEIAY